VKNKVLTLALALAAPAWAASPRESIIDQTVFPVHAPDPAVAILGEPLPHAPISSGFGWRLHPVLNLRRFHNGVDYAAAFGTPVYATDDGVVEEIVRRDDYGLYLRIRHSDRVETGYAHLARVARGLRIGSPVARGEVVAGVGDSGWATGPHLFYEVFLDGARIDPVAAQPVRTADAGEQGGGALAHFLP
jgi:murein DD-endopeptidase MepM/ murein hydrolase activator NlpD